MAIQIESGFGYVILSLLFSILVHHGFMATQVTAARKRLRLFVDQWIKFKLYPDEIHRFRTMP